MQVCVIKYLVIYRELELVPHLEYFQTLILIHIIPFRKHLIIRQPVYHENSCIEVSFKYDTINIYILYIISHNIAQQYIWD
jgi:hypothetical protein